MALTNRGRGGEYRAFEADTLIGPPWTGARGAKPPSSEYSFRFEITLLGGLVDWCRPSVGAS